VLAAVGDALALRTGLIFRLVPGASIESGDQIHTGPGSYLQIRFTDWASFRCARAPISSSTSMSTRPPGGARELSSAC